MVMKKVFIRCLIFVASMQPLLLFAEGIEPFADLLYWHASQETASSWASITSGSSNTVQFKAPNVDFNWNLGFRGGVTYEAEHNDWDSSLAWTYFQAKTNSNIKTTAQLVFPEFFSGFSSGNFFFGGGINWRLNMNMLDFDFGHKFAIGKSLIIRPAIGIKGGTINQTANCVWNAVLYNSTEQVKNNFMGIGPSFRLDSRWNVYKNFSLIGNFATALMWGNWKISDVYNRPNVPLVVNATTITTNMHNEQLGTMMFDYCLGLEWASSSKPGKPEIKLQIGYEMQFWSNQLRLPTFQQLPVHGDLTLQGATCRIIIDL